VATSDINGVPVAISGSSDQTLRVWDLHSQTPIGSLAGHSGPVAAVAATVVDGRPVAISAGDDHTLRLWDMIDLRPIGVPLPTVDVVNGLAVIGVSRARIVTVGYGVAAFRICNVSSSSNETGLEAQ